MNAEIEVLGIIYQVHGLGANILYLKNRTSAALAVNVVDAPNVTVGGAVLGFIPAPVIDVFLPKNIDELIKEFFIVA